jgi:hypothetical protein
LMKKAMPVWWYNRKMRQVDAYAQRALAKGDGTSVSHAL